MIKFENTEVVGWEHAIRGMRNPMNSWEKSDSRNNIITLCGSSRFKDEYLKVQKELSLKGYLVLSLGLFGHSGDDEAWAKKDLLDRVHLQKIDMSSAIFVIDVDGYVGETTKSEIEYAISRGKTVYFYSRNDLDKVREIPNGSFIGPNDLDLMKRLWNAGTDHRKFMRMIVVYTDITAPLYWWKEFDTYKIGTVANSCSTMHKIAEKEFTLGDFSWEKLLTPQQCTKDDFVTVEGYDGYDPCSILSEIIITTLNLYRGRYLETKDKKYWWQMIQLLPSSYNQKRTVMMNYEVLANIYKARRNHKLDEWSENIIKVNGEEYTNKWLPNDEMNRGFCDWIKTLPYSELITGEDE
nr:MAG TPA: CMP/hydroxymethyl CMP hydrolase [Caudoviricetes sp.]